MRKSPLVIGTLGRWSVLAPLPKARSGVMLTVLPAQPSAARARTTTYALFAIGGYDGASTVTDVDKAIVTVVDPVCSVTERCLRQAHTLTAWSSDAALSEGRAFGQATVISSKSIICSY